MNLKAMTKKELYELAKKFNVKNRSKMTKPELIKALKSYEQVVSPVKAPVDTPASQSVTSTMTDDAKPKEYPEKPEYPIPDRYNIDTVVLLPINPKREYVYWEVSDKTVEDFCKKYTITNPIFILKVFSSNHDGINELASVKVANYGNWYFDLYCPDQNLWAEVGMLDSMGNYFSISISKKIKMPADKVCEEMDKETWMTVGEKIEKIYELSGENEIQKEELISSARMHKELFKKLHTTEGLSSTALHKDKGGDK